MQVTIDNTNFLFIPSKITSFDTIVKNKKTMENDIYQKFEATAEILGELIICKDVTKNNKLKNDD